MDNLEPSFSDNPFVSPTPGLQAEPIVGPQATIWPTVLGIVAIVFGSIGILGGCFGAVGTLAVTGMMSSLGPTMDPEAAEALHYVDAIAVSAVGMSLLRMVLAGWLLSIGIGLLRKRRWAARMTTSWSLSKILLVLSEALFNFDIQRMQFRNMAQGAANPIPEMEGIMTAISLLGLGFGIVWGCALPVFLWVWFRRNAVRAEVAGWSPASDN